MTPAEVAALLAHHGLAPNWRNPIRPAPILSVGEKTRVVHLQQSHIMVRVETAFGWCCRGRTWT